MATGSIAPVPGSHNRRPVHRSMLLALGIWSAATLAPLPAPAEAKDRPAARDQMGEQAVRTEIGDRAGSDFREFYAARGNRPLWLNASGRPTPAVDVLRDRFDTVRFDGIKRGKLKAGDLDKLLERAASGKAEDVAKAELALSRSFVAYVKATRSARRASMIYESAALTPGTPTAGATLQAAASARSLSSYVGKMGWMHPLYAPLRDALADNRLSESQRRDIAANLARLRSIPANPADRYVLIDAASARLWMYEKGRPVDTMRVVVGKPDQQTPSMAGFIRYAIVNPYWNVPEDLARDRIAPNVLDKGFGYLQSGGYQVLSDWGENPRRVDPALIDWRAVAAGRQSLRVRQLPGGSNFMGDVKFMFPNAQGIYLHDTPDKDLLRRENRQFSSGCVRLEDARRLGRWLLKKPLPKLRDPEQRVNLPELVPVYITYLTAMPENGRIAFRDDVYARGGQKRSNSR